MGDIHGNRKALNQCLERSKFNFKEDKLIFLGDICDGFPYVRDCIETLMKMENLVFIRGNHDQWTIEWMTKYFDTQADDAAMPHYHMSQGGKGTFDSYEGIPDIKHLWFLDSSVPYHVQDEKVFVHAGLDGRVPIDKNSTHDLMWTRSTYENAMHAWEVNREYDLAKDFGYKEVYIGHTTTERFSSEPANLCNVWAMDQGAGWNGYLSIMDIDTKEVWMSDKNTECHR